MRLHSDASRRRWRIRGIVCAGGMWTAIALTRAWAEGGRSRLMLFALPLAGLGYVCPAARAAARLGRRLAARPLLSASLVGALALASSVATSLFLRTPQPEAHDEFSYLLAADTFAHGRLTNPTHPMWVHFESFHILFQPTYASKYPPGQGMVMAIGQVLLGRPIAGVWLSAGLACGALTWMLAGWMPGRWALLGGLLAALHPLTIRWSQSYWGGLVAVVGGALLLGGFGRIVRRPRGRHAAVMGIGLAILANSRPYEGLVLAIPFVGALGIWLSSRRAPPAGVAFRRIVLPLGCVLLVTGTWMLYYNFRVTGELLTTPYQLYERTYASIPVFVFQDGRPAPLYRHEQMRSYYGAQAEGRGGRSVSKLATVIQSRARRQAVSYFGSLLVVAAIVISLPFERNRWQHLAALTLGVFTVGLCVTSWTFPHYAAPAAGLALLITVRAMRRVGAWRLGGIRLGRPLAQALGVLTLAILAVGIYRRSRPPEPEIGWRYDRARIAADLSQSGAMQLVIVRYSAKHDTHEEWVYNSADIDASPIVWAREMDAESTTRLITYFQGRQAWLLEPDRPLEGQPLPYPAFPGPRLAAP